MFPSAIFHSLTTILLLCKKLLLHSGIFRCVSDKEAKWPYFRNITRTKKYRVVVSRELKKTDLKMITQSRLSELSDQSPFELSFRLKERLSSFQLLSFLYGIFTALYNRNQKCSSKVHNQTETNNNNNNRSRKGSLIMNANKMNVCL